MPTRYLASLTRQLRALGVLGTDNTPLGGIKSATVTLTDAQIKALPTTPVEVVPAPGVGKITLLQQAFLVVDAQGGAYTIGAPAVEFWIGHAANGAYSQTNTYQLADDFYQLLGDDSGVYAFVMSPYYLSSPGGTAPLNGPTNIIGSFDYIAIDESVVNRPLLFGARHSSEGPVDFTGGDPANTLKVTCFYAVVNL